MKNLKKLFASVASIAILVSSLPAVNLVSADYGELEDAYDYAYGVGVTTMSSIDAANMYGTLTRAHMAKMMVNRAEEIKGLEPDTDKECSFTDLAGQTQEMKDYIEEACQLGLMGVGITAFNPNGSVTRAQFGTVLSRVLRGDENEGGDPYYADHLAALKDAGIMNNISNPMATEVRGYVMLMLMRADDFLNDEGTDEICETPENQTACSLGLDTCPEECMDDEDEPEVVANGNLGVELSDDTMDSQKLPKGAEGVPAATYTVTADEDITLKAVTLKRVGMDAKNAVSNVAIFIDGQRASNSKAFNSSSDDVTVYLNPSYELKGGEEVELVAKVTTLTTQGAEFALSLEGIESTAEDTDADFPIVANEMEIGSVNATSVTVATDGSVSTVKVGNKMADVLRFKITNGTINTETVEFSSITLKEEGTVDEGTELENFRLYNDGEEVAMVSEANGKYITFNLDDPMTIGESKTEKFVVKADIVGGASKNINLVLDKELDVTAISSKYGYVNITDSLGDSNTVNIDAGALTIISVEPSATEIRKDKNDIVFGTLKVSAAAGKQLELQKFKVTIEESSAGTSGVLEKLENIELYDETRGNVYDLSCGTDGQSVECSDTNLNIPLRDGKETVFSVRADTLNTPVDGYKFNAKISNIGTTSAADFYVVELGDDKQVTDITPSSITFKVLEGKASAATVNQLTLSTSKSAVIGSTNVEAIKFNIEAGNSSALNVKEIKALIYTGNDPAKFATNAWLTQIKLYKGDTLIKAKSASQLANGVVTFDGLSEEIAKNGKQEFTIKLDVVNDSSKTNETLKAKVTEMDIEDEDNDDITSITNLPITSVRLITIKGVGSLTHTVYTSEAPVNTNQNVLGNITSNFVAAFELVAQNEGIKIKDLYLTNSGTAGLKDVVSEVILYKADKTTEIARKSVSDDTVTFNSINYVVAEGSEKVYVKVVTHKIGKDQAGTQLAGLTLAMKVTAADGNESNKTVTVPVANTSNSKTFTVVPVRISNVAFVNSYGSATADTKLNNGENTVAILKITTDSSTNTDGSDNSSLETVLRALVFNVTTNAVMGADSTTVERVDGPGSDDVYATVHTANAASGTVSTVSATTTLASASAENNKFVGEAYYAIKVNVSQLDNDSKYYAQVEFSTLDSGNISYTSDDSGFSNSADDAYLAGVTNDANEITANTIAALNLGFTKLTATKISQ